MADLSARRLVDWSSADPYDREWRYRMSALMYAVARQLACEYEQDEYRKWLSYAGAANSQIVRQVERVANECQVRIDKLRRPWYYVDTPAATAATATQEETMIAQYAAVFGDPRDPVRAKEIDDIAAAIERESALSPE